MTTTKTDLSTNFPSSSGLIAFQNGVGNTADADQVTANYNYLFGLLNVIFNYCIDQTPQTTIATTYTAQQSFSAGIKTDSIATYTAGGSLPITLTGAGTATIVDGTYAAGRILTTTNVNTLAPSGNADMQGANGSTAGVHGLVPAPAATDNVKFLRGDATWAAGGDATGPSSATDNAIARFDGTTGKLIQNSTSALDDSGYLTVNAYIAGTGFVNAQTGTTYTLAATDNGREVTCTNASTITVTVTTTSIPADYTVIVTQLGAGQVSFTTGGSAVLRNVNSQTKIAGQYGVVRIKRVGSTNDFVISGSTGT